MNHYAIDIETVFREVVIISLDTLTVKLTATSVGPLGYDQSRDVVQHWLYGGR